MLAGLIALLQNSPVAAIVAQKSFYEDELARGFKTPCVVLHRYNSAQEYDFNGPADVEETNVQADLYADTAQLRDQLRKAVKSVLDSYVGTLPDGTVVQGCFLERSLDPPYVTTTNTANTGFRSLLGYRVVSRRA